jgi:hypothetical protein
MDLQPKFNNESPIFKLLLVARCLITDKLNWILGNGCFINPWEDKIWSLRGVTLLHLFFPSEGCYNLKAYTPYRSVILFQRWHMENLDRSLSPFSICSFF